MKIAPQLPNESGRLVELERYGILDTPRDPLLDNITQTAADICGTPIALISLIDSTRQWFKSSVGMPVRETSRDQAFCTHAILEPDKLMEIEDTALDERFHDNPLVVGEPMIRFYAGKPLVTPEGFALGTLCVIDNKPLRLSSSQQNALCRLAQIVIDLFNERRASRLSANDDIVVKAGQLGALITESYKLSANSAKISGSTLNEVKQNKHHSLDNKNDRVVDTLNSIVSSAIEYELHIEPNVLINFIDYYCTYLQSMSQKSVHFKSGNSNIISAIPATFLEFIFDQTLLNETALVITAETGEQVTVLSALDKSAYN